jgi:peptidoglycan/xylan/chitin deacetylase (PgdA/CDA1 family)
MGTSLLTRSTARARGKMLWAGALRATGILYLAKRWVRRRGMIVLTFHRVLEEDGLQQTASLAGMVVRRRTFADFLGYAAEKCEFADLAHEPEWTPNSRLKLAITFDDGWSDNASVAFPVASAFEAPMLIFIVPDKMGTALPFWPERAATILQRTLASTGRKAEAAYIEQTIENLKGLPAMERNQRIGQLVAERSAPESIPEVDRTMTWEQTRELDRLGVRFGSHTSTHEILTSVPLDEAKQEISASRARIEQQLNKPCRLFSYPNGDSSAELRNLVESAGYKLAFLNQSPGVWTHDCDPYQIPRVNVSEFHLVNADGDFSPLTFDYAVVWSAAKGLMRESWRKRFSKLRRKWNSWFGGVFHKNQTLTTDDPDNR